MNTKYMSILLFLLMGGCLISYQLSYGQMGNHLTGKVINPEGKGIGGVSVSVEGAKIAAATDSAGMFRLPTLKKGAIISFSFLGYLTKTVKYDGGTFLNVQLEPDQQALDEVVVVGYGTQKKSDLTGSVASIKADDIEKQGPRVNFAQSLQGAVPGLNVSQTGNSASSGSINIDIRGQNSIAASNSPLIILDGVPYDGGLNYIDQSTIESVEILKDASSAAIYGARGANGVIIVTTKKGKSGKPSVAYEGSYGIKDIYHVPDLLTGPEHWAFGVERYGETAISAKYPTRVANYQNGIWTDWVKEATRQGTQNKHAMTLSGGTDLVKYLFAGNYADVKGIARGDQYKQVTGRVNLSIKPAEWMEIGTNSQYTYMDNSGMEVPFSGGADAPGSASSLGGAFYMNPLISPYDANGNIVLYAWPELPNYTNPLSELNALDADYNRRLFTNNYIQVTLPLKGLSYKLNTGYTERGANRDIFWGSNTLEGLTNQGQSYSSDTKASSWLIENLLYYNRQFGDHKLDVTLLYSAQKDKTDDSSLAARGFPTEDLTWYQPGSGEVITPTRAYTQQSYLSQMGRVFYSYKEKYLLTATVRRDGYSAFGSARKFGVFPSLALGWNLHMEPFITDNLKWVDNLKLRLSYGSNGNQAISAYSTLAQVSRGDYLTGPGGDVQGVGYIPGTLENSILGWETTRSLNVGLDYGVLKNRITGSLDFYQAKTHDLLLNRAISPINGVTSITSNIGKVQNTGIEATISSRNIVLPDFEWGTTINISHNQNKILDLYGNGQDDINNGWFLGKPISVNYGYVYNGVWQSDDDIPNSTQPNAKPGDVKVKDTNGDGQITPDDRDFIGQGAPKYTFGFNNQFRYKRLTLNVMVTGVQGVTKINGLWDTDIVYADAIRNTIKQNWWSPDNPTNDYPANRDGANPYSVRFYKDASFIRFNNISLYYDLTGELSRRLRISKLAISAGLINGFTITKWNGLDPEYSDQRDAPLDRMFTFGLNIVF